MVTWIQRHASKLIALMLLSTVLYGGSRLYFQLTAGFTISNITSDLSYDSQRDVFYSDETNEQALQVLKQPFYYLGKGCQSYVFGSEDGQYVIKFLKYQRFRPQRFLSLFSFFPPIENLRQRKLVKKNEKLNSLFSSWKIASEYLAKETGILFVHLNKTKHLNQRLIIYDKLGLKHSLNIDDLEFVVQRRAKMLCPMIDEYMQNGRTDQAKMLLSNLLKMVLSEYERGFADNDHALMQNTGVIGDHPVHIDVGQFEKNDKFSNKNEYAIELFSKMYKFRIWLARRHPELETFLTERLLEVIGPKMWEMTPRLKTMDEAGL
ncbi:MAG: hypothetical protein ACSNEK_01300 [Parachlamydiaceae bacterium]